MDERAPRRELSVGLRVNGAERRLTLDARTTRLDALRDGLHLAGTKRGCDLGQCGARTVLRDGRRIKSCLTRGPWWGPCRMIVPMVDELAGELAGRVNVGKLNATRTRPPPRASTRAAFPRCSCCGAAARSTASWACSPS
jgi:hypothetical protein